MTTNFRRIALLTGVSAAALGTSNLTATAALASPQGLPDGAYAGGFTVASTIEICDLANNVTGPTPPCFFGVIDTTGTVSTATINSFLSGQAAQVGTGTMTAYLTGLAEWGAYASANNPAGDATANAVIDYAFVQFPTLGFFPSLGSADYLLDNDGTMVFEAVANAFASDDAFANATLFGAPLIQFANVTGAAALSIDNDGDIGIGALAYASGGGSAFANANIGANGGTLPGFLNGGIIQAAYGSTADVDFNNSGAVDIVALAVANGGTGANENANANASVDGAILQYATASTGPATIDLNNAAGGSITIAAIADAGGGNANAYATLDGGIMQHAAADSTAALVGIDNDGSILIEAIALAEGTTSVDAVVNMDDVIDQEAYASTGLVGALIDNDGSIVINGLAYASGTGGATANADLDADEVITQFAGVLGGTAYASIANGAGDVIDANFTAVADARGGASLAYATAEVDDFIRQTALALFTGYASAVIANAGAISLDVNAIAHGYLSASAFADISGGIEQNAVGKSGATALIDNDLGGVISINAAAIATGGDVFAGAAVNSALVQNVQSKSGDAFASILNDGAIDIGAFASAVGDAQAVALINGAVVQNALASEYETVGYGSPVLAAVTSVGPDANVTLINNGTIDIHATALAHDTVTGPATATAIIDDAIIQNATATDGFAGVVIDGTGSIDILAYASAIADSGSAFAYASVNDAIDQNAISTGGPNAGLATAYLSQGGGIDILAIANASGLTAAYATALVGDGGIDQFADATAYATALANNTAVAIAQINNNATINIIADAQATATGFFVPAPSATAVAGFAGAFASVEAGIHQTANAVAKSAVATVGGLEYDGVAYATAVLNNTGAINIGALAEANGGIAYATALVGVGIDQNVFASGGSTAVAGAFINNDGGDINVFAAAAAYGTFDVNAYASVGTGISQNVDAFAKEGAAVAVASIQNSGDIVIGADAVAVANGVDVFGNPISGSATAVALVGQGIFQDAYASGLETNIVATDGASFVFASANIDNDGLIAIVADASAVGDGALAVAAVGTGISQDVTAKSGVTVTAIADIDNALYATIAVGAEADAIGGDFASAIAVVGTGIDQFANAEAKSGPAFANVSLSNDGLIAVTADAFASASGFARAIAVVSQGIDQAAVASGPSGTAAATLVNTGTILISADAYATGNTAIATAVVGTGIQQGAFGVDLGYASISNALGGEILIVAEADADGSEPSFALAQAIIGVGISQQATATATSGVAIANINNAGTILVLADAEGANASEGSATALAVIGSGINQFATASFVADADLDNSGSIDVIALASATADDDAFAFASIGTVLFQGAFATGSAAYASADIVNTGSIVGLAVADALGGDTVSAFAFVSNGIVQVAAAGTVGSASGVANASFVNGTGAYITMIADADALGGGDGLAVASAAGGVQAALAGGGANVGMTNNGSLIVAADADVLVGNAAQKGASAVAFATATGWSQVATAQVVTADTLLVFTTAFPGTAVASDYLTGVGFTFKSGVAAGPSGPATATFVNNGVMSVTAGASATGDDFALAVASVDGINQTVLGDPAYATVQNYGTMVFAADAFASGDNGAAAIASANGIDQYASAAAFDFLQIVTGTATLHYTTGGTVTVALNNNASDYATVFLSFTPTGHASVLFENSGSLVVAASAEAVVNLGAGDGVTAPAFAGAFATGVEQFARGATATAEVDNSGYVTVLANAVADGATAAAATAVAVGISQGANAVATDLTVFAHYETVTSTTPLGHTNTYLTFVATDTALAFTNVGAASVFVDNSGSIAVGADADAVAASTASAVAVAIGIGQAAAGTEANAGVVNSGDITVIADAYASGSSAFASAFALGIGQALAATSMNALLYNTGDLTVLALAGATGSTGAAFAHAIGYSAAGTGGGSLNVDVFNGASIFVGAEAIAPGTAVASAQGIVLSNAPTVTVVGTETVVLGNPITGYLTNAGVLDVIAYASGGGTFTTPTGGGGTTTIALSSANATGISISSGINTMVITNTGEINVDAVTVNGGPATARGIFVTANGDTTPLATDLLTINNDGDIIVRQSTDGGATFLRGMAIDVASAPNNTVINLLSGNIFGHIDVQTGDAINVLLGETVFDGIINPECMPLGGPTALVLDDPDQNLCGQGDMFIGDGGNFHMVINPLEGPSYAFVNTFTVDPDGTLELDLPPADGTAPIGTYPQIFADVVTLNGGTLIANIQTPNNGLFDDTVYENVIDGLDLSGEFDQCIATGVPANSLLLDFDCFYDNLDNVDLRLDRIAFDVPALNENGRSVGEGLECIYDVTLTGGIADMLADLFLFTDPVNYTIALNQLSGSVYANYLQSFPSLGVHYNDILAKATDCEIPALAGSVLECRASSPIHLWGQADYQWRKADGDVEAGTAKSRRMSAVVGLDVTVGGAGIVGGSIGYVTNHVRDRQFGDDADADGLQVGLYGVYDPGTFYVKAMTTYSWYDGDSERNINFAGLAPGATFAASPNGDPDVTMWTAGIHAGARFALGGNSVLTPYLNYDYVNAKLKGFTETNGGGADLTVFGGRARHSFLTGGVKWATQMGGVVPEVNLGYRYRFGDRRSDFSAAFLGDEHCEFDIISAAQKRGTFLAGVSVGGKMGPVDLRIGYEGEFNSDVTSHAGNFKFVLPLGGKKVAAAAPTPVLAPPMPAEEVAPAPVETPPPPPPPSSGERGK